MNLLPAIDGFFFRRISASGFGLMRMAWAATALAYLLPQWRDITLLYSDAGMIPHTLSAVAYRNEYRFSLLDTYTHPAAVYGLFLLLLTMLFCAMIGWRTRFSTVVAALLLFSFHEANLLPLGGGDTVLRNLGFLLMIAPQIRAFSLDRAREQWRQWETDRTFLRPLTMSIWPWRLLVWQFIVIYIASGIDKATGTMWWNGTAVASALHHGHFARWPMPVMDIVSRASGLVCAAVLVFEFGWLLMLMPNRFAMRVQEYIHPHAIRRALLLSGVLFHSSISALMDVGSFSVAMLAGYLGLLLQEDFRDMQKWVKGIRGKRRAGWRIVVLYDAACHLCRRSMFTLLLCDHLQRLQAVNFRDRALRKQYAPDIALQDLDRSMHIKIQAESCQLSAVSFHGFDAFRKLAWHIPILWPLAPLLYIPGIPPLGRTMYAHIAKNRNRCADGYCVHDSTANR